MIYRRKMDDSESLVFEMLNRYCDGDWKFFEVLKEDGSSSRQIKNYDGSPACLAYPDFENYKEKMLITLVEVKGYNGWFDNRDLALAFKYSQYKEYIVVQRKEETPIFVVFVIWENAFPTLYWNSLNDMRKLERDGYTYIDKCQSYHEKRKNLPPSKYIFWSAEDFRTDIENLGK